MTTIQTARLQLRPFTWDDLDRFAAINGDAEVRRFMWDGVLTRKQAAAELARILASYRANEWDYLAVIERASGELIGQCGLFVSDGGRRASLAYLLDKTHWGRGFAVEATRAYLDYAVGKLPLDQIRAVTPVDHTASRRVMEKLGMRYLSDGGKRGDFDVVVYVSSPDAHLDQPE